MSSTASPAPSTRSRSTASRSAKRSSASFILLPSGASRTPRRRAPGSPAPRPCELRTGAPIVAEVEGRIVGTGCGSAHGAAGWVGVIFVAPECRGNGLGRRITRAVLDDLEARGCRTQILIASPLGRPIYEREGFTVLERQVRFSIDGLPPDERPLDPDIRPFAPDDLGATLALDACVTGEDRGAVLRTVLSPQTTYVATDPAGVVRGYLARAPWRGGALIAHEPGDALRLLEIRRHSTGASGKAGAGVLESNTTGRERLRAAGWHEEMGNVRMIPGRAARVAAPRDLGPAQRRPRLRRSVEFVDRSGSIGPPDPVRFAGCGRGSRVCADRADGPAARCAGRPRRRCRRR
ncbi:MAG TPA: GNAT family N-acetyltransferase [Candidatus Limnocylindrales bacterium]|nr:GNAT family N-acetyltransferase [Candidatus Limnocylindrales bacterium]